MSEGGPSSGLLLTMDNGNVESEPTDKVGVATVFWFLMEGMGQAEQEGLVSAN